MKIEEYQDLVVVFLNHLEDVLDDVNFDRVSTDLWNRISRAKIDGSTYKDNG